MCPDGRNSIRRTVRRGLSDPRRVHGDRMLDRLRRRDRYLERQVLAEIPACPPGQRVAHQGAQTMLPGIVRYFLPPLTLGSLTFPGHATVEGPTASPRLPAGHPWSALPQRATRRQRRGTGAAAPSAAANLHRARPEEAVLSAPGSPFTHRPAQQAMGPPSLLPACPNRLGEHTRIQAKEIGQRLQRAWSTHAVKEVLQMPPKHTKIGSKPSLKPDI